MSIIRNKIVLSVSRFGIYIFSYNGLNALVQIRHLNLIFTVNVISCDVIFTRKRNKKYYTSIFHNKYNVTLTGLVFCLKTIQNRD